MENIEERIKFRMDDENIPNEIFSLFGELIETVVQLQIDNKKLEEEVKDLVERNIELDKKYMLVLTENKKLKVENEKLRYKLDNISFSF